MSKIHRTVISAGLMLILGITVACGGGGPDAAEAGGGDAAPRRSTTTTEAPTTTTTAPPTTTTTAPPTPEELFAEAVRADPAASNYWSEWHYGNIHEATAATVDDLSYSGRVSCTGIPQWGLSGMPDEDQWDRLAVKYLCPEHQPVVDAADADAAELASRIHDGTYTVGIDIQPGVYEANDLDGCYWARMDSVGEIIDNNFITGAPRAEVTIQAGDHGFTTEGCGRGWKKIG